MTRDMTLATALLAYVEVHDSLNGIMDSDEIRGKYDERIVSYHIHLLETANYIKKVPKQTLLTWQGHDFLEKTRDEKEKRKPGKLMAF